MFKVGDKVVDDSGDGIVYEVKQVYQSHGFQNRLFRAYDLESVKNIVHKLYVSEKHLTLAERKCPYTYSIKHPGSNKEFHFKSYLDLTYGDKVLCDTQFGLAMGEVTGFAFYPATKWIISKLDTTEYDKAMEEEKREKEKKLIQDKINQIESELNKAKEELGKLG